SEGEGEGKVSDIDIVHAITYSILLLNTDLHVVQQSSSSKMSRSAYVKNTMEVVVMAHPTMDSNPSQNASEDYQLPLTTTITGAPTLELPRMFTGESTLDLNIESFGSGSMG